MLTPEQRSEFERHGLVRLAGAVAKSEAEAMAQRIWAFLAERDGILRDDPQTWVVPRPRGFQELERSGTFAAVGSPAVCDALDALLGEGWQGPERWGQLLGSFPADKDWWLPHNMWHLDAPAAGSGMARRGVKVFGLLTPAVYRGGATLAVTGSHRVAQAMVDEADSTPVMSSAEVRRLLKRSEPWFRALWRADPGAERERRCMDEGTKIGDVEVRVVELTGEAGDVILMDPSLLHVHAPHARGSPRFVTNAHVWDEQGPRATP